MLRQGAAALTLFAVAATTVWAQGLNAPPGVTKDDWEEINFEFNSSVLVDGFPSLLRLAELLQKNPGYKVAVQGHTDNLGGTRSNDRLGLARANAVRDFLVKYGANANQITASSDGKSNPRYPGQKSTYSRTDEARYMNRRVSLVVTDAQGRQVSAGGAGEAIQALEANKPSTDCCNEILKRLDKLDDIERMLKDLADQNADLRKQVADLKTAQDAMKQNQQALQNKVEQQPKPPSTDEVATAVTKQIEAKKDPRFQLLGVNVGMDSTGNTTFSGKGRYFAPYGDHFAFEAQAEYLYFQNQREGQFDAGLVDRLNSHFQTALFASFKHVSLVGDQNGGTLGQGAFTLDYIFKRGKVGLFGTKGFMNDAVVNTVNATDPVSGALLNHLFVQTYLSIVDQAGVSTSLGLWGNNYLEGNAGYLHGVTAGNRFGGTLRFIFPISSKIAFTLEGGMNETMVGPGNDGRAVVGLQFGNMLRPKDFLGAAHPVPIDPPRIRYEVLTRKIRNGDDPPVANAGPDQLNVPAGTITLNGSESYSPDGLPITFQWVQQAGPVVTLSNPTGSTTTFQAVPGAYYTFELTVRDSLGGQGTARVNVSTQKTQQIQIQLFTANPGTITSGQSSNLSWSVLGATSVTISGVGTVGLNGSAPVSPTQTTTYTLTASNGTQSQTATATVVVNPLQAKLQYCYASPTNITAGQSATLNWAALGAASVSIQPGIGAVANSGSVSVSPTQTTNYTITATGPNGSSTDSCSLAVTVGLGGLPRIVRFSAAPSTINSGQSSTLSWVVRNAQTVTISTLGNVALTGSQSISPAATTTYTITATNQAGSVTATATVTVNTITLPAITSFTASPNPSPAPGTKVTLTCNATGAASLNIAGAIFNSASASTVVSPSQTTTYTCIATNSTGQTATSSVTVTVQTGGGSPGQPPVIVVAGGNSQTTLNRQITLDASASISPSGNTPLTYQWTLVSSGTPASIANANSAVAYIDLGLLSGEYDFQLTVTDSKGLSSSTVVKVILLANSSK